jgi:hypothetical protein
MCRATRFAAGRGLLAAALLVLVMPAVRGQPPDSKDLEETVRKKAEAEVERALRRAGIAKKADDKDTREIDPIGGIDQVVLEGKAKKVVIKSIDGAAAVTCADDFEVEEIEIVALGGVANVKLTLAKNARLKKLVIGKLDGAAELDCTGLAVQDVEVGSVTGVGHLKLKTAENVTVEQIDGAGSVAVERCKDFTVKQGVGGVGSVDVNYYGTARCEGDAVTTIRLNKIDPPK